MLTPDQLALRKKVVGASEAAAVLGLSPWESPADVYWRKVGDPEPEKASEAMERGIALEPMLVEWARQQLRLPTSQVLMNCPTTLDDRRPIGVTPDGIIIRAGKWHEGVEAKTSSEPALWGEPGSDEIPEQYIVQTQTQMEVMGFERVWVPVLILGFRPETRLYCVNRNAELGDEIANRVTAWWNNHVVARVPPEPGPPPLDFLKRLRREPKTVVMLGQQAVELVDEWEKAKAAKKVAEDAESTAKASVMALLGVDSPAEAGVLPDGRTITFMQQPSPPGVNRDILRSKYPDAFSECVSQGFHRVLRIKKSKV